MQKDQLKLEIKENVIEFLNLVGTSPQEIGDDEPLFGGELDLDSIDSLELIVMLERKYGIKIQDPKEGRKVLVDVNTMADYIENNRTK